MKEGTLWVLFPISQVDIDLRKEGKNLQLLQGYTVFQVTFEEHHANNYAYWNYYFLFYISQNKTFGLIILGIRGF